MNELDDRSSHYPTKATDTIPAFHSLEEEAEFWDTHDLTAFWDEGEPATLKRNYSRPVQVRLDTEADLDLQIFAQEAGTKKSTLARQWLLERIKQEKARHQAS